MKNNLIIPIIVALFNVLIILFPSIMISAAKDGLSLWFNNVLPALLPFIITTNILIGLGVVNFLGVLLEPIMYPLFRVPGVGGFAMITGMTSGYPMGAKIIATLREDNLITQVESHRLMSFCNNSGPLFILGAVGVGMLQSPQAGFFILFVHYVASITTGLLFRYWGDDVAPKKTKTTRILSRAFQSMRLARQKDKRNFGQLLGESVKNAMETIASIGGFIILFCVIVKAIEITPLLSIIKMIFSDALNYFGISEQLFEGLVIGLIETTNGSRAVSLQEFSKTQLATLCAIISFGGFCIHAQVINFLSKTDIKTSVYLVAKVINGIIAAVVATIFFPYFNFEKEVVPTFFTSNDIFFEKLAISTFMVVFSITIIICIIIVYNLLNTLKRN